MSQFFSTISAINQLLCIFNPSKVFESMRQNELELSGEANWTNTKNRGPSLSVVTKKMSNKICFECPALPLFVISFSVYLTVFDIFCGVLQRSPLVNAFCFWLRTSLFRNNRFQDIRLPAAALHFPSFAHSFICPKIKYLED